MTSDTHETTFPRHSERAPKQSRRRRSSPTCAGIARVLCTYAVLISLPACLLIAGSTRAATVGTGDPITALWEAPPDIGSQDLFNGRWGAAYAPAPDATYAFVRLKKGGANLGVIVRDPMGRVWHVKQTRRDQSDRGDEGPVEVALSRILSAVGYHQPPVYYLPSFRMADRSGVHVEPGGRFRLDDTSMHDRGTWAWRNNPFVGTQPYHGLLVILLAFNSWDLKDSNNTLYDVERPGHVDHWYVVRDLGGALGDSKGLRPRRNDIGRFERYRFLIGLDHGVARFAYGGKQPELVRAISVDDLRWAADHLNALSARQWSDAFRAGGYPPDLAQRFLSKIRANVTQAKQLAGDVSAQPATP